MSRGSKPIGVDVKGVIHMATKGASNRYGNTRGSKHQGEATEHINFPWAKDFNKKSLDKDFDEHGKELGLDSKESYKQHAIKFANTVDRKNCVSFVDVNSGATYKYNKKTSELAIITKDGYVATYFKPKDGYSYYKKEKDKRGSKSKKRAKGKGNRRNNK